MRHMYMYMHVSLAHLEVGCCPEVTPSRAFQHVTSRVRVDSVSLREEGGGLGA